MENQNLTRWQRLAREKFGCQVRIEGDGPYAVRVCSGVELCDLPMRAEQIKAERCGQFCNHVRTGGGWHAVYLLVQKEAARRRFRKIAGVLDED